MLSGDVERLTGSGDTDQGEFEQRIGLSDSQRFCPFAPGEHCAGPAHLPLCFTTEERTHRVEQRTLRIEICCIDIGGKRDNVLGHDDRVPVGGPTLEDHPRPVLGCCVEQCRVERVERGDNGVEHIHRCDGPARLDERGELDLQIESGADREHRTIHRGLGSTTAADQTLGLEPGQRFTNRRPRRREVGSELRFAGKGRRVPGRRLPDVSKPVDQGPLGVHGRDRTRRSSFHPGGAPAPLESRCSTRHTCALPVSDTENKDVDVVALDERIADPLLVTLTHNGSSNFQVSLLDANGERVESLANAFGQWTGTLPVNLRVGDSFAFIEINADGAWEITLDEITTAPTLATEPGST